MDIAKLEKVKEQVVSTLETVNDQKEWKDALTFVIAGLKHTVNSKYYQRKRFWYIKW